MMPRKLPTAALLAALCAGAVGLSGCGSTVAMTSSTRSTTGDGLGAAPTQDAGTSTGDGTTGSGTVPTDGSTSTSGGGSGTTSGGGGTTSTSTTGQAGTSGSTGGGGTTSGTGAVSHGPIKIGMLVTATSNAGSFGVSTGNKYSEQDIDQALVDGLNAQGGLGGRKIIPIFGQTDTGSSNSEADFAANCEKFTTDNKVAAVLGYQFTYYTSFERCLSKKGVPHLETGFNVPDRPELKEFPMFESLDVPTIDRRGLLKLEHAALDGVLTPKSKLGIISDTCPSTTRSLNSVILPKAKALGLKNVKSFQISCTAGASAAVTALQNAELQFASSGVDQVMFHAVTEGPPLLLFAETAETQNYHPSYLMTSLGNLDALRPFLPVAQAKKVNGYGWIPTQDIPPSKYPATNSTQKRCLALLKPKGISPAAGADFAYAYNICEAFFVYEKALLKTGGNASGSAITSAVDSLGSGFPSLLNKGGSLFSTGFPDAARVAQHVVYQGACSCFAYVGAARAIPTS